MLRNVSVLKGRSQVCLLVMAEFNYAVHSKTPQQINQYGFFPPSIT